MKCEICGLEVEEIHRHHQVPKSRGGSYGDVIKCCYDCSHQVHMLFTNKELEEMSLEELKASPQMQVYINWKRKHPGKHPHKMSRRVKERMGP